MLRDKKFVRELGKVCLHNNIEIMQGKRYHFKGGWEDFTGFGIEKYRIGKEFEKVQCADCKEVLEVWE